MFASKETCLNNSFEHLHWYENIFWEVREKIIDVPPLQSRMYETKLVLNIFGHQGECLVLAVGADALQEK